MATSLIQLPQHFHLEGGVIFIGAYIKAIISWGYLLGTLVVLSSFNGYPWVHVSMAKVCLCN